MADLTLLSPGSIQLSATATGDAHDDTGCDINGVAWEIEQVIIAGEGFAASPSDVHIDRNGILTVGQSLFNRINQTDEDEDKIPGQCTIVVKATSLVDPTVVQRLKVLVGYSTDGGGGGGGGGGDSATTDVYFWNQTSKEDYPAHWEDHPDIYIFIDDVEEPVEFTNVTLMNTSIPEYGTAKGMKLSDVPVGSFLGFSISDTHDYKIRVIGLANEASLYFPDDNGLCYRTDQLVVIPLPIGDYDAASVTFYYSEEGPIS